MFGPMIKRTIEEGIAKESAKNLKYDHDKIRWELVDLNLIEEIAKVLTYGARKYKARSWQHIPKGRERYFAAAMRHLNDWQAGKKHDESGLRTMAHALCNVYFLMWYDLKSYKQKQYDKKKKEGLICGSRLFAYGFVCSPFLC